MVWARLESAGLPGLRLAAIGDLLPETPEGARPGRVLDLEPGRRAVLAVREPDGESTLEVELSVEGTGTAVTIWRRGAPPSRHAELRERWEEVLRSIRPAGPAGPPRWTAPAALLLAAALAGVWWGRRSAPPDVGERPAVEAPAPPAPSPPPSAPRAGRLLLTPPEGPVTAAAWSGDVVVYVVATERGPRSRATTVAGEPAAPRAAPDPNVATAPDGRRQVFARGDDRARADLQWVADDGRTRWLTDDARAEHHPRFRPDGRSVVYATGEPGRAALVEVAVAGGHPRVLVDEGEPTRPVPTAAGGVVYFQPSPAGWDLAWAHGDERGTLDRGVRLPARGSAAIAPDGRTVAWARPSRTGDDEVVVHDLDQGVDLWIFGAPGSVDDLAFGPGGTLLFTALPTTLGHRSLYLAEPPRPGSGW